MTSLEQVLTREPAGCTAIGALPPEAKRRATVTVGERLLEKILPRTITRGVLTLIRSDRTRRSFGAPAPGYPEVTISLGDRRVARDILSRIATFHPYRTSP